MSDNEVERIGAHDLGACPVAPWIGQSMTPPTGNARWTPW